MWDQKQLNWTDVKSAPVPVQEYLEKIVDANIKELHYETMTAYKPKNETIHQIQSWLKQQHHQMTILAIGATWCPDCQRNLSHLAKIMKEIADSNMKTVVLGGIKTKKQLNTPRTSTDPIRWAVPPSPPETLDPKFDLTHIPTFYLFLQDGTCIGRIVENPPLGSTLEEEIWRLIQVNEKNQI